jgi:RNA polymerase sigma-70 factor (ECF subfamily)
MSSLAPSDSPSDDLLARARGGEAEAFGRLFEAAAPRVLLYIRLRLSPHLARELGPEDVLQETALSAFDAISGFEPRGAGAFARWLCAVAENRLRDAAQHQGALKRRPAGERQALSAVLERLRLSATGPASAARRDERHEQLRAQLEALEPRQRQALLARYFRGATTAQVGLELGTSETGARRLLARAIARLGRELGEESA